MIPNWKNRLHEIIFEADTTEGKAFDVTLIFFICISVFVVILDSVNSIQVQHGTLLRSIEWFFTIIFTIEYLLRIVAVRKVRGYIFSFFGIVDIISILPSYLGILFGGMQTLLIFRVLRLLRFFRVFKMARYVSESAHLMKALKASMRKITIFIFVIITIDLIMGALMYIVEGPSSGFTNIPTSMYWAIVTMTTVGFGDIVPVTVFGKILASALMILGYGIIAVPTGIVTVELARHKDVTTQACPVCIVEGHDVDAKYCKKCGSKL
ncbi:MAG: ion transporter [Nanoarchaeota archaeon]|nr:ion transporter [Nanoarchaeota archaeon]MBU1270531.1 ion transporter [Nanoarchaeota archaeon]MBU1604264.1 ion transporter [Nanoarchaeota archaeon]MBU2442845.1 ion transporter [Nanoarchaeota archaeon]